MSTLNTAPARRIGWLAAASLAGLLTSGAAVFAAELPLKVCADPDNLPFSSSTGTPKGFYIDLADRIAAALDRAAEPVWQPTYLGKRAVRGTLLANRCDLYIGLPADVGFMGPQVVMSAPFAAFHYALVLAPGSRLRGLADLRGQRVAVQFASPPQSLLAGMDGVEAVTVLSPEAGMRALADGRADAAYLWGPSAGYLNKTTYAGRYQVVPTDGPALSWKVAIGFRRADGALRERVQQALDGLGPWLAEAEAAYGFPLGTALPVARVDQADAPMWLAAAGPVFGLFAQADVPGVKPPASNDAQALRGRELFNSTCAHCHGTDAASPEKRIDLRRLNKRYGDKVDTVFSITMQNGRPDKGMPIWKGVITDAEIGSIKTYLDTVQQAN